MIKKSKKLPYVLKKKQSIGLIITGLLIIFFCHQGFSQSYSLRIDANTFTLDGQSFKGYSTLFTQPYKEVKKEWWRYVNSRTIIFNKKTHLVLTIPAKGKESNTPLKFVSQLTEDKKSKQSTLRLALATNEVTESQKAELNKQAKNLLKDFKVSYFTDIVQNKIEDQEQTSKKISLQMDKYLLANSKLQLQIEKRPEQKNELAGKLQSNTVEVEKLQIELKKSQALLNQYKKELTLIK